MYGNRNGCRVIVEWMKLSCGKIEVLVVVVEEVVGEEEEEVRGKIEGALVFGDDSGNGRR